MEINVKELEYCKIQVNYTADVLEVLNKKNEVVNAFKKAPTPGFRPGKASVEAIKIHYKDQIEDALKRALAEDALHNTTFEKKLKPHGPPKFTAVSLTDGKFTCEFELFVRPQLELQPYKGLDISKPVATVTVDEICEKMLQELRVKFGEVVPYTEQDFVEKGDNVIVNYTGSVDGEKIDGLCAEGEMLNVGTSPVAEFDNNLLGMVLGESRTFNVNVPDSALPSYAGKVAVFNVTLVMGSKTIPCALDDTLASKVNLENYEQLRLAVLDQAKFQMENAEKMELSKRISTKLVESNSFEVPNWLTLSEAQYLAARSNLDWNKVSDSDKEKMLNISEKNVKLALILDKIREEEPEAQLTDQEIFKIVQDNLMKTKLEKPIAEVIQDMNNSGYLQVLFARIKDEYALDFVIKNSNIIQ